MALCRDVFHQHGTGGAGWDTKARWELETPLTVLEEEIRVSMPGGMQRLGNGHRLGCEQCLT